MRHRFLTSTAAMLVFGSLAGSAAAAEEPLKIGDRVRVTAPKFSPGRIDGIVVRIDEQTLTIVSATEEARHELPRSSIATIEVARGTRSRWKGGALVGAGWGVGLGLLLSNPPSSATEFSVDGGALAAGIAAGAAMGALVGAMRKTDRWITVPPGAIALSIQPARGQGVNLAMTVSF